MSTSADPHRAAGLRPWTFILAFGLVSLLADMVYEGARSIIGPYLATLGASATVVGIAAGVGEFIGYGLRVVSGYLVARGRRYWTWTIVGYSLTVLSVPLLGATTALAPALLLYGTERLGKLSLPAKDTLLSHASSHTGRGTAFGVHQAIDQTGPSSARCCWPRSWRSGKATTVSRSHPWPCPGSSSSRCSSGCGSACPTRWSTKYPARWMRPRSRQRNSRHSDEPRCPPCCGSTSPRSRSCHLASRRSPCSRSMRRRRAC